MADDSLEKSVDDKVSASRGPAYPYVSLERAVERANVIAEKGAARQKMPPETFYRLWSFGAKSSGARQTMAALNYYNLVEYVGRGNDRKVQLTELALRIVLDKQPNSSARKDAIKKAALEPAIFRELHDRYAPILPDDVVIETYLKIERAFNDEAARATIKHFRDTMVFAGLDQPDGEPSASLNPKHAEGVVYGGAKVGDLIDYEVEGVLGHEQPVKVIGVSEDQAWVFIAESNSGIPMDSVIVRDTVQTEITKPHEQRTPPANPFSRIAVNSNFDIGDALRTERFDTDEGAVEISWPSNLSSQSVEDMQDWLELLMKRIERRAKATTNVNTAN